MTVTDLRCDRCGRFLAGPAGGEVGHGAGAVRFLYHPGNFLLKDDSGLLCERCWREMTEPLGARLSGRCAVCGTEVEHARSLHLHQAGDPDPWQLCALHGAELLNTLRTVEPKLDADTFRLFGDWNSRM